MNIPPRSRRPASRGRYSGSLTIVGLGVAIVDVITDGKATRTSDSEWSVADAAERDDAEAQAQTQAVQWWP